LADERKYTLTQIHKIKKIANKDINVQLPTHFVRKSAAFCPGVSPFFERRLFNEEKQETQKRIQELRVRLQAIQMEASKLVASTVNLSENVKVAVMQGSVSASEYQIGFFESIVQMIVSFRKKIDNAVDWLQNSNKRAEKKNYWSQYKKKGTSFLLSGESYSQRSAG